MGRRKSEPVRHTCPDIDRIISSITSIVKEMDSFDSESKIEDLIDSINNWSSELSNIGTGKFNQLEELRASNSALREWGSELYSEAEQLESERDALDCKVSDLESKVEELEEEILNLSE